MPAGTFIAGVGEVERKFMVTYVNIGTHETPEWEALGVKIEDSSIEFNPDVETITDILGITTTTVNKTEPQQSFEPHTIRKESKFAQKIVKQVVVDKDLAALSLYEVLIVYAFMGAAGAYDAELQTGCTIEPTSIGGSGRVDFPFNLHYSNKSTWGTVATLYPSAITFAPTP